MKVSTSITLVSIIGSTSAFVAPTIKSNVGQRIEQVRMSAEKSGAESVPYYMKSSATSSPSTTLEEATTTTSVPETKKVEAATTTSTSTTTTTEKPSSVVDDATTKPKAAPKKAKKAPPKKAKKGKKSSEPKEIIMSKSLPFMECPEALTGELAGDVGFDPIGFAVDTPTLMNYREAEVKHARLAMLAAAGWPLSEVLDAKIASVFGFTPLVDASDRVPSVLNGGLDQVSPLYWVLVVGLASAIEVKGTISAQENAKEYFPGNFGFDPLGLYPKDDEGKQRMQLAEIKHGRLAMIAVTAFAVQEWVSKIGVVDETPIFFYPISQTLKAFTNDGYIQ